RADAFVPAPGLKEFLLELKSRKIRIALVTSGLHEKAWPEIVAAFRTMGLGDPLKFYDAIVTAGSAIRPGQAGTLGELQAKPHPWLYAEAARVGLGIPPERRGRCIGLEDSGAGVVAIRLAGFAAVGIEGGNIRAAGVEPLLHAMKPSLPDVLDLL
ncbi:MAG: haloacid dehalogenase, partial [Phycisphaerae bacterium SM23_33]